MKWNVLWFYVKSWWQPRRGEDGRRRKQSKAKKSFKNSIWSEKKEIEFINIDTDGKDFYFDSSIVHFFPLTLLWLCYPISKFFFYSLYISLDDDDGLLACLLVGLFFCILYRYLLSIWEMLSFLYWMGILNVFVLHT